MNYDDAYADAMESFEDTGDAGYLDELADWA